MTKIKCPCCGQTMVEDFEICTVCDWQSDPVQNDVPDYRGGANVMSLNEAREAFKNGEKVV